jgi:hypothetical protein
MNNHPPLDNFGRDYLRLVLEIDKHIDGYVDAYIGPPPIKAEVQAAPRREPAALLADLERLQANIPTGDAARQAYLQAVLRAIDCSLRLLNGETFAYLEEVERLYDIRPQLVDDSLFTAAHQELDTLLPGAGALAERMESRRRGYELGAEQVLPLLALAQQETRQRTRQLISLPDGETVEVRLASDQPWSAYNWYLGNGRSLIEFNTDVPVLALNLLSTFAHEGYPGHHTEAILKEKWLYQTLGYAEQAVALLHSPAAVIAEGIATTAIEIIFPQDGEHEWNETVLLPAAGLKSEPAAQIARINQATRALRYVSGNAASLYHSGRLNQEQTVEYIQTYSLASPQRARQTFRFISNPLYRSYIFTYSEGYDLIERWAAGGHKGAIFERLLFEQIRPSQLAAGPNGNSGQ